MSRDLSATIRNVVDARYGAETHDVAILTLPATTTLPSVTLYCSGKDGLTIGSQLYLKNLRAIGTISYSLGGNADSTSITLENISQILGASLTDSSRTLDGASVRIDRAFLINPDTGQYEIDTLFIGVVDGFKVNEDTIELTVVSDMSQRNARIANVQATQRCRNTFNVNGSGVGPDCAWQTSQGGDPLTCDLVFDSAGGCLGHNNQFHFGGVPTLLPKDLPVQNYPENPGPGGYEPTPTRNPRQLDPDFQPWREFNLN